jgi:hypothetical protein
VDRDKGTATRSMTRTLKSKCIASIAAEQSTIWPERSSGSAANAMGAAAPRHRCIHCGASRRRSTSDADEHEP